MKSVSRNSEKNNNTERKVLKISLKPSLRNSHNNRSFHKEGIFRKAENYIFELAFWSRFDKIHGFVKITVIQETVKQR